MLSANLDVAKLEANVEILKTTLKDGLLATDIWDKATGLSLAAYNQQPAAVALFTEITNNISASLTEVKFPPLGRYYLMELEGDHLVIIIRHGEDLIQGILMNSKKVNLGLVIAIVLPKMLEGVKQALG
jgi:uracil phosphoribosyltransferase